MGVAGAIAVFDGLAAGGVALTGLLAIPPVLAATRASVPETTVVAGFCLVMALLSGLWNQDIGSTEYLVEGVTVMLGGFAGIWVASLRVDLTRESDASELLAEMGSLMERHLALEERAERIARIAVPALADAATVDLLTPNGSLERIATVSSRRKVEKAFIDLRERQPVGADSGHPVAEAIRTGEPQLLEDLAEADLKAIASDSSELDLIRKTRPSSALVFPLKARGSVLGALSSGCSTPTSDRPPRPPDRPAPGRPCRDGAGQRQAARAAGPYRRRPSAQPAPALAARDRRIRGASRFLAAGEAYEVGGDFYDAFRTGSGSWTIVIGDVCGKGPEAAALTALARYTVRTASDPETPPSEVLRTLHDSILTERSRPSLLHRGAARSTAPHNGRGSARLTIALGGHPPPLALREDGRVDVVGEPGTLLGALPSPDVLDVDGEAGARRVAGSLHRRHAREPRSHQSRRPGLAGNTALGRQRRPAPRRSPRCSPAPRSSARAASLATTSRCWCCAAVAS